jgi:hypothetical protein
MVPLTVLSKRGGSARGSRQVYASASPGDGGTEPGPGSQSDSDKELNAEESVARLTLAFPSSNFFWTLARRIWIDKGAIDTGA